MKHAVILFDPLDYQVGDAQHFDTGRMEFGVVHQVDTPQVVLQEMQEPLYALNQSPGHNVYSRFD